MAPAKIAAEDLLKAIKDESVIAAFTSMFEWFLNNVLKKVNDVQEENVELRKALLWSQFVKLLTNTLLNLRR